MADERHPFSPKRALDERGLRPRKRFGQNFLVDHRFAERIAGHVPPRAFVIEIGGGTGSLTHALARRAAKLVVLEIDRDLVALLKERFSTSLPGVEIRECDALEYPFRAELEDAPPPRLIVGNLPYSITTPLFERILSAADRWEAALLMVQREYAKRLAAAPGTPEYGSLTVFVSYYCSVETLFEVGAGGFYPPPAVASSVVRLVPRRSRAAGVQDEALLLRLIRAAFAQRRKTLSNCVEARGSGEPRSQVDAAIVAAGLDPSVRGERLSLRQFIDLSNALSKARISLH